MPVAPGRAGETEVVERRRAAVIGAGAVGIATGLYLRRDGWRVTVIEPEAPGEKASGGDAGLHALAHVAPVAMPGTLGRVPRMLLDPEAPLQIRWRHLPKLLPWLTPLRTRQHARAGRGDLAGFGRSLESCFRGRRPPRFDLEPFRADRF
jgi:glycine/D-amino acid oxidase-like deaminating enzyme